MGINLLEVEAWLKSAPQEELLELIPKLPIKTRPIFRLLYLEKLPFPVIAERLHTCEPKAKSLHRSALIIIQAQGWYK